MSNLMEGRSVQNADYPNPVYVCTHYARESMVNAALWDTGINKTEGAFWVRFDTAPNANSAMFCVTANNGAITVERLSAVDATLTAAVGTPASVNVYWANNNIRIQNLLGATQVIKIQGIFCIEDEDDAGTTTSTTTVGTTTSTTAGTTTTSATTSTTAATTSTTAATTSTTAATTSTTA
jgi:hypothetical protein